MLIKNLFSESYTEAREKFIAAAQNTNGELFSFKHESQQGKNKEDLYTDVLVLGDKDAKKFIVISSATHGVEGYAGSAMQVGFLKNNLASEFHADTAIVLIHALNPHGFSNDRRVNEDNIDLNRNFIDHKTEKTDSSLYAKVQPFILPEKYIDQYGEINRNEIDRYIEKNGLPDYQEALCSGQYSDDKGVFYGGKKVTWSQSTWQKIVSKVLSNANFVAHMDIHTGLGPYGYGELMYAGEVNGEGYKLASTWFGDNELTCPSLGNSSTAPVNGTLCGSWSKHKNITIASFALEYGTVPLLDMLEAVRADNWLYINGEVNSDLGRKIKAQIRAAFYIEEDKWKTMLWERFSQVSQQLRVGTNKVK